MYSTSTSKSEHILTSYPILMLGPHDQFMTDRSYLGSKTCSEFERKQDHRMYHVIARESPYVHAYAVACLDMKRSRAIVVGSMQSLILTGVALRIATRHLTR